MNARDIAYGYGMGFNDGLNAEGGGKGWTFPSFWDNIPDPNSNQIIMYIESMNGTIAPIIGLYRDGGTINFGDDGFTYEYPANQYYDIYHIYLSENKFIIKINANGSTVNLDATDTNYAFMQGQYIDQGYGGYSKGAGAPEKCSCIRAIKIGSGIKAVIGDALSYALIKQY